MFLFKLFGRVAKVSDSDLWVNMPNKNLKSDCFYVFRATILNFFQNKKNQGFCETFS